MINATLDVTKYKISLYTRYVVVTRNEDSILITWKDLYKYIETVTDKEKEYIYQYTSGIIHVENDVFDYFDNDSYYQLKVLCRMFDILIIADYAKKVLRKRKWQVKQNQENIKENYH